MKHMLVRLVVGSALTLLVVPNTGTAHHLDSIPRTSALVRVYPDLVPLTRTIDGHVLWPRVRARGVSRWRTTHPAAEASHRTAQRRSPRASVWRAIAQCESGNNWSINTGNGYYGGLQMDRSFQRTYGPEFYARLGTANNWPVWAQMRAADRAWQTRGYHPWPICGRRFR